MTKKETKRIPFEKASVHEPLKAYHKPRLEIINVSQVDICTASGEGGNNTNPLKNLLIPDELQ